MNWLTALAIQTAPVVLVTVAKVEGSGPREPGAKMLVSCDQLFDTIGGGHLELRAQEIAREMLREFACSHVARRRLERFPLGPSLGQCCGGVVYLAFELMDPDVDRQIIDGLVERWNTRQDTLRIVPLDSTESGALLDGDGVSIARASMRLPADCRFDFPSHVMIDTAGQRWLIDACRAYRPHLMLFGAGHVGTAIVSALAALPCHVTWVDERVDMFPPTLPGNVRIEPSDMPEVLVDGAPAGTSFLVMTHSHALDQTLSERILQRSRGEWFGLIGSQTKRMQFEHRLRARGIAAERIADMVCPIGIYGITGKAPGIIAASVSAQLLQAWEAAEQVADHGRPGTLLQMPGRCYR